MTGDSLMSLAAIALTLLAAGLLIVAAVCDLVSRTIPNSIPLGLAVLGVGLRALDGSLPWAALAAGIVFATMLLCWLRGWMGGGDVKLLGACALLVPPLSVFSMVTSVGLAGGALALVYLAARRVVPPPDCWLGNRPAAALPRTRRTRRTLAPGPRGGTSLRGGNRHRWSDLLPLTGTP